MFLNGRFDSRKGAKKKNTAALRGTVLYSHKDAKEQTNKHCALATLRDNNYRIRSTAPRWLSRGRSGKNLDLKETT